MLAGTTGVRRALRLSAPPQTFFTETGRAFVHGNFYQNKDWHPKRFLSAGYARVPVFETDELAEKPPGLAVLSRYEYFYYHYGTELSRVVGNFYAIHKQYVANGIEPQFIRLVRPLVSIVSSPPEYLIMLQRGNVIICYNHFERCLKSQPESWDPEGGAEARYWIPDDEILEVMPDFRYYENGSGIIARSSNAVYLLNRHATKLRIRVALDCVAQCSSGDFIVGYMQNHFVTLSLELGLLRHFEPSFDFKHVSCLSSSANIPWLIVFANEELVGVIDARCPTMPLISFPLASLPGCSTGILLMKFGFIGETPHIVIVNKDNHLVGIALDSTAVGAHKRILTGTVFLLPTAYNQTGKRLFTQGIPRVLGLDFRRQRLHISWADDRFGCVGMKISFDAHEEDRFDYKKPWPEANKFANYMRLRNVLPVGDIPELAANPDPALYENLEFYTAFTECMKERKIEPIKPLPGITTALQAVLRNWKVEQKEEDVTIESGGEEQFGVDDGMFSGAESSEYEGMEADLSD